MTLKRKKTETETKTETKTKQQKTNLTQKEKNDAWKNRYYAREQLDEIAKLPRNPPKEPESPPGIPLSTSQSPEKI